MKNHLRVSLVVATAATLGAVLSVSASHAEDDEDNGGPAASANWENSIQNRKYHDNIDAYSSKDVWTRKPSYNNQVWIGTYIRKSPADTGVYTLKPKSPPSPQSYANLCITSQGAGNAVLLETCEEGRLDQQWEVNTAEQRTLIVSADDRDYALQGYGNDKPVKLQQIDNDTDQLWTRYNKS